MSNTIKKNVKSSIKFVYSENNSLSVIFHENDLLMGVVGEFNKNFSNIILDGKVNVIDKKIEGNFQLDIYDKDKQKKFSAPVEINNNKLKILFFELDLNSLF